MRILFLADNSSYQANTTLDHMYSFVKYSKHDFIILNPLNVKQMRKIRKWNDSLLLRETLNNKIAFDAIFIHYSLYILGNYYLPKNMELFIQNFKGPKIFFIQDDYRYVNLFIEKIKSLGITILFTLCPEDEIKAVWGPLLKAGIKVFNTLAGYVPENLKDRKVPMTSSRPIDVFYRSRELPYWLGSLGQEKIKIAQGFLAKLKEYQATHATNTLKHDIGWKEENRIYGDKWVNKLASSKAVLGTESGSSITDFEGNIERAVKDYLAKYPKATFEDVSAKVLKKYEGNIMMNVISPRMFEAVALRTALVLFPGHYSGILKPWQHYIPLNKDFSNFEEVINKLQNPIYLNELANQTYNDIIKSGKYSYKQFIKDIDQIVKQHIPETKHHNKMGFISFAIYKLILWKQSKSAINKA